MIQKGGLGRGLSSLIPGSGTGNYWGAPGNSTKPEIEEIGLGERIQEVIIDQIEANPKQPRKDFSHDALDELIQSIKHYGILQPLLVRKLAEGRYQLIF